MRTKKVKNNNGTTYHHTSPLIFFKGLGVAALFLLFCFVSTLNAFAQLERFPVQRKNPTTFSKSKTESARTKAVSLSLPFWDDFSFTSVNDTSNVESNTPLTSLWSIGGKVWINDGLGINPPTINVASFDGLDAVGLPYRLEILLNGFRDTLQSQPINLDEVLAADRNSVFLSFFYQWQGNGEAPDANDYMQLEFKDNTGAWQSMMKIGTKSSLDKTIFYDTIIQITDASFFHDAFQFRFQNYGRQSGPYDTWNIDYVYLNKGRTINDNSFPDRAVASTISPLLGTYSAMPLKHFFASPGIDSVTFDVKNLDDDLVSISYTASARFTNVIDSVPSFYSQTLTSNEPIGDDGGLVLPFERIKQKLDVLPDAANTSQFNPASELIIVELRMKLISGDTADVERVNFDPVNLKINDTVSTYYYLKDYYAYDDGVAEYSAGLTRPGNRLAYQFTRDEEIPDSLALLNGFDIYFPRFGFSSNLTVDFTIYDDADGKPGDVLYTIPSYLVRQTDLNVFQFVRIGEPFFIGNTYYIGWKQPLSGNVIVGLDVSNNTADKMMVYTNGEWNVNDAVEGSLMIRPHFGKAEIITGIEEREESLQVFPNPNKGEFYIRGKYDRLEIITLTGQSISFTSQWQEENTRIAIQNPSSGLYILKIVRGNTLETRKILID